MNEPVRDMVRSIKGWANEALHIKNPFANKKLYPLAYINGCLYFTNNPSHITLNDKWGNGTIYYIRTENFAVHQLNYNVQPENAFEKGVKWSSSNEKVATVDEKGKVTAVGLGNATITLESLEEGSKIKASVVIISRKLCLFIPWPVKNQHLQIREMIKKFKCKGRILDRKIKLHLIIIFEFQTVSASSDFLLITVFIKTIQSDVFIAVKIKPLPRSLI
jgi:hypothetical protein